MALSYWRTVSEIAWEDTVSELRLNSPIGLMMWLLGTVFALAGLYFLGSADASRDELVTRIFLALAVVGAIPLVYAWKFLGTPPMIHKDLRGWTAEIEAAVLEAEKTDKAIFELNDQFVAGARLVAEGAEITKLRAWEDAFDLYVKENFDAGFFVQMCSRDEYPNVHYTIIYDGSTPRTVRNVEEILGEQARIEAKIQNARKWIALAGGYYRGRTINSLQFMASQIRRSGLREHRLQTEA